MGGHILPLLFYPARCMSMVVGTWVVKNSCLKNENSMKRFCHKLAAVCISIGFVLLNPFQTAEAGKPAPPLKVAISPVDSAITPENIKAGDIIEFKVTAVSFIDVSELSLEIELAGGTKLISGDTAWRGPAVKNEEKSITVTVQAPEKGKGRLSARAGIHLSAGTRFSRQALYTLGLEVREKADSKNDHPVRKDKKGRDVIEYR